jgi:pimeloyl-ACP methyl ester carboxylesterase
MSVTAATVRRGYIDNIHGQMHYRMTEPMGGAPSAGPNPPLLCLHQTPKSGWDYEPLMPDLGRDRVVLAPDTPGYGGSDGPPAPVLIGDYADAMIRFMDDMAATGAVPPGMFDVIGYHTGAATATDLANRWPDRVRRVILVGLAAYDAETRAQRLATIDRFPVPLPDASNVTAFWKLTETMNDARIDLGWKHASMIECLRPGDRLPWGFISIYKYDFLGNLAALRQDTLVLAPEDDLWVNTRKVAPIIPNGRCVELPGAAHGFFKVEAERVSGIIRGFLAE